jgi:hypothetical protein
MRDRDERNKADGTHFFLQSPQPSKEREGKEESIFVLDFHLYPHVVPIF